MAISDGQKSAKRETQMKRKMSDLQAISQEYSKDRNTAKTQMSEIVQECNQYKEATRMLKDELLKAKTQMDS